ncbi:VOC family protein [Candidatus Poribacteria bacterium]|jgi:lactoylglutathione lyase|nr:glyoxalase [Candidatus Poribacteria bacterium]MBP96252.1 glyoxalase [Candidatus Poribacteria bacterium]MCH2574902.1 VOC family protein [Candidatus Poribacteria bacterium]
MAIFLHTRIRVSDLDQSIKWYQDHLGFQVISRSDKSPAGNQIVHLELPGNDHTLELTYSDDYDVNVPEDLMHFAIGVPDLIAFCNQLENEGVEIWPSDWRQTFPTGRKMAFIDDPDGYEVELLERAEEN